eukprot:324099-Prymnesium_polylepis.1
MLAARLASGQLSRPGYIMRLLLLVASELCSPVFAANESSDSEPHVAPVPAGTVCQNATWLTEPPIRRLRGRHI